MQIVQSFFLFIFVGLLLTLSEQMPSSSSGGSNHNVFSTGSNINSTDLLIQESIDNLSQKMKDFKSISSRGRPFVTLAYAQSIDGKIALILDQPKHSGDDRAMTSSNFAISGPESLRLTHALRSIHDAILVGSNTLSIDNPRLNNRLWPPNDPGKNIVRKQPIPIILDTHLRHIRSLGKNIRAQNPIVCCSEEAYQQALEEGYCDPNKAETNKESNHEHIISNSNNEDFLSSVKLLPCDTKIISISNESKEKRIVLDLQDVLSKLHLKLGISSLMIEGGASVLSQFVSEIYDGNCGEDEYSNQALFDCLCVTISPKLLGANGLASLSSSYRGNKPGANIGRIKCIALGNDCVLFVHRKQ